MKLIDYIRCPENSASAFAARVGIAPAFLYQIAHGKRKASAALARAMEAAADGAVTRRDLRPDDWGDIWPELVDEAHPWPVSAARPAATSQGTGAYQEVA